MGVSKIRGTPKWMVFSWKTLWTNGWFGGVFPPLFLGWHPYLRKTWAIVQENPKHVCVSRRGSEAPKRWALVSNRYILALKHAFSTGGNRTESLKRLFLFCLKRFLLTLEVLFSHTEMWWPTEVWWRDDSNEDGPPNKYNIALNKADDNPFNIWVFPKIGVLQNGWWK